MWWLFLVVSYYDLWWFDWIELRELACECELRWKCENFRMDDRMMFEWMWMMKLMKWWDVSWMIVMFGLMINLFEWMCVWLGKELDCLSFWLGIGNPSGWIEKWFVNNPL